MADKPFFDDDLADLDQFHDVGSTLSGSRDNFSNSANESERQEADPEKDDASQSVNEDSQPKEKKPRKKREKKSAQGKEEEETQVEENDDEDYVYDEEEFRGILYGQFPGAKYKKYTITLPSDIEESLEEMLDALPTGFKSSKSSIIASLLKDFLDKHKRGVISYGKEIETFIKRTKLNYNK